jgi:hypothetical protein
MLKEQFKDKRSTGFTNQRTLAGTQHQQQLQPYSIV